MAIRQPSGTVTLVFTDIEGSTRLLHELGQEAYRVALAEHRGVVREAFARFEGYEVDYEGDAFFYAFGSAQAAVGAIAEAMRLLAGGPIRIRVGVHTGEPGLDPPKYVGVDVHKAARIMSAGHGGQVLLSKETRELVAAEVTDLGEHRVKDFTQPVWIFQLGSELFPPLKTISNTNLPRPASSFVGREREVAEVVSLVRRGARLVTLTGPGGSGKTRLAIEAAAELIGEFKAGVFWIGLAALREPALVLETVARVLGAKDALAAHIGEREMLLLLDNLEQVVDAAPELAELVEACPNLVLLVTSRELLRVRGDVEYAVLPLAERDAVALFCERSQLKPVPAIEELTRRLDNMPLALELAAARTKALPPEQILERLSQRLDLFKGGRDADPRQQTLRATIDWSHDLLDEPEQRLFAHLAVFAGGCTLKAAEEVCEADLDTVQALVEKSLLRCSDERYWMLETVREYAAERLQAGRSAAEIRRSHAEHYLELAEHVDPKLVGPDQTAAVQQLNVERDNLRQALSTFRELRMSTAMLQLAVALSYFWYIRGYVSEGLMWLGEAVASPAGSPRLRARALHRLSVLLDSAGEYLSAREAAEASVTLYRELEPDGLADALNNLANVVTNLEEYETAERLHQEALGLRRELRDSRGIGSSLNNLAVLSLIRHDNELAAQLTQEALSYLRSAGDPYLLAIVLHTCGSAALNLDRLADATPLFREGLSLSHGLGSAELSANYLAAIASLTVSDEPLRAARILGCAEVLLEQSGAVLANVERELFETTTHQLERQLGKESSLRVRAEGRLLELDKAVEDALASIEPPRCRDRLD